MARHDAVVLALLYLIWTLGQYSKNAKLGQIELEISATWIWETGVSMSMYTRAMSTMYNVHVYRVYVHGVHFNHVQLSIVHCVHFTSLVLKYAIFEFCNGQQLFGGQIY